MTGPNPSASDERSRIAPLSIALPGATLFMAVLVTILLVAGFWATAVALGPWSNSDLVAGMYGIGLTAVLAAAGVLILSPWKKRLIIDWMTMWLAATVFRVLGTPIAAFLLYSAVSPGLAAKPFGLAVALTYIATLFVEAAVLANYLKAAGDRHPHSALTARTDV